MTKKIFGLVLAAAIFGGTILADDGNMGNGGRTGCDGDNPPSTCCDPAVDPVCDQSGFETTQSQNTAVTDSVYMTTAIDTVANSLGAIY